MAVQRRADLVEDFPLPTMTTQAPPGSAEKIELMRARYSTGQQIFHPDDAIIDWECYTSNDELISLKALYESLRERQGQSDVE